MNIFERKPIRLQSWAEQHNVLDLLPNTVRAFFIRRGEDELLERFSKLCHFEVTDRSAEFTLEHRIRLYRKWLASGAPTLMLLADANRNALVASIVLSLTKSAYRDYWHGGMDALDIDASHLLPAGEKPTRQFLLVDMLASHKGYLRSLQAKERALWRGIGFRAMTRHIAEFRPESGFEPVLLCSTVEPSLRKILPSIGFEASTGEGGKLPIFRADFSHTDGYSEEGERLIKRFCANLVHYSGQQARSDDAVADT